MPKRWRRWWRRRCGRRRPIRRISTVSPSPPARAPSPASASALPSCAACGLALKIPLTGVTTLEAMAAAAIAETGKTRCAAIHDARRGEAYLLLKDDGAIVQPPTVLPFAEAVARIKSFGACAHRGNRRGTGARELWATALPCLASVNLMRYGWRGWRLPCQHLQTCRGRFICARPMQNCRVGKLLFDISPFNSANSSTSLAALHALCFERGWDAAALSDMLASPGTFAFCHDDGFVVGRTAADEAEILTLAVRPGARGKGLGRALLQAAIDKARALGAATVFLEVGTDNPACAGALCRIGFRQGGGAQSLL